MGKWCEYVRVNASSYEQKWSLSGCLHFTDQQNDAKKAHYKMNAYRKEDKIQSIPIHNT